jgi:hypothetical protein
MCCVLQFFVIFLNARQLQHQLHSHHRAQEKVPPRSAPRADVLSESTQTGLKFEGSASAGHARLPLEGRVQATMAPLAAALTSSTTLKTDEALWPNNSHL